MLLKFINVHDNTVIAQVKATVVPRIDSKVIIQDRVHDKTYTLYPMRITHVYDGLKERVLVYCGGLSNDLVELKEPTEPSHLTK